MTPIEPGGIHHPIVQKYRGSSGIHPAQHDWPRRLGGKDPA
jgi:hypothetical protein